jgi:hypothetical protein
LQEIPEARSERLLKAAIAVRPAAPAGIIAIHSFSRALAITLPRLLTVHVVAAARDNDDPRYVIAII